ncbi:MAG TPA: TIM barrel protein [Candidatus Atribacteria bacterium]|nr:TIM barrel protein [Candidatus Atribacteria bacterium]
MEREDVLMIGATIRPDWWQEVSLKALLQRLEEAGCQSIELHYTTDFPVTARTVMEREFNLTIHAPTAGDFNGAFFGKNQSAVVKAHRQFLDQIHAIAAEAGKTILINFHGGEGEEGSAHEEILAAGREFVHWLGKIIHKEYPQIVGALEMLPYDPARHRIGDNQEELLYVTKGLDVDRFGMGWDMGHYQINTQLFSFDGPPREEFIQLVNHTHIHELNLSLGDHCPLGRGSFSVKPYVQELVKIKYDGVYNLELSFISAAHFGDPIDELIRSINLLKEMI